jgi:hypothetical protein
MIGIVAGPEENHAMQTPWLLSGARREHWMSRSCKSFKFIFNPLKHSGHYTYHQDYHAIILRSAHTVYLCVLCGSENTQRYFHIQQ